MQTVLITGVTGFIGGHLADHLLAHGGFRVVGLSRRAGWAAAWGHLAGRAELRACDLHDTAEVERLLRAVRPDWVAHVAGYANTGASFREPARCWADNLGATQSLYEAVGRSGLSPRILFAGTGLVYGDAAGATDERAEFRPASPYAASKAAADLLSYQVTRSPGLDVVRVRLFNQIGPRQSADYAVPNFARQIAAAEAGRQPPVIKTGDLSAERDVTDVRDVAAAFRLLLETGRTGEAYNAARGRTWPVRELLARLVAQARVSVAVEEAAADARKGDTAVMQADVAKLHAATGWRPAIDLDRSLADVLEFWRSAAA
jgi:GDP-4-dehydro-6-deoxy-D-mannose reductase